MPVTLKIKMPPDVTKLGPVHSTLLSKVDQSTTTIYHAPNYDPVKNPVVGLSFVRNNRVVGYFSTPEQAKQSIDYLIQREREFGADI